MSAQGHKLLVVGLRTTFGHLQTNHKLRLPAWIPVIGFAPKRTYYLDSNYSSQGQTQVHQGRAELISPNVGLTQRNLSAMASSLMGQCRPLSRYDFLDLGAVEENTRKVLASRSLRHFIVDPDLARVVAGHLERDLADGKAVIFEYNPGPGILTRALLNSGAQRVVALEGDKAFLPDLKALERNLDGQLEVVHCDFFKLDPMGHGTMKPPSMYSEKLFKDLGISQVPWTADVPVKVVGIFPQRNERKMLWKLIFALFERTSIFRYGRVELLMFMSEKQYMKLVAPPGDVKKYKPLGVLWQLACEIELLHKEPFSSFVTSVKRSGTQKTKQVQKDDLCLVRLTPHQRFFTSSLTPGNGASLIVMVKQCLTKKKSRLIDQLNTWSPENGEKILAELGLLEDIQTGQVFPEEYKILFENLHKSKDFIQRWLYDHTMVSTMATGVL
ncbi:dimethyladenosine transferase 2, mitochondrial-like [Scleropages formosus]|uniref:rRNA adenine N(6)-methyltransferase n=1 Tax=Scleropages formosus TaxID=113540 RepID=A0A8C9V6H4_SCLFO|nr:dimethyladenosine transferase 2, mitochondrial-like [Scleropages formosus]XP_018607729.2 dimethyladenosine transferase 2, mitochondrial-like [Scleropages formosus]